MRLAISNLSWAEEESQLKILQVLNEFDVLELEIAAWKKNYEDLLDGRRVVSMQSILTDQHSVYNLFESQLHREVLSLAMLRAISDAENLNCSHIVFGCPRNRQLIHSNRSSEIDLQISNAVKFFREICDLKKSITIGFEPIAEYYGCNFINNFREAVKFVKKVDRPNFKVNLDIANLFSSNVTFDEVKRDIKYVSHIHVSEEDLKEIKRSETLRKIVDLVDSNETLRDRLVFSIEAKDLTISEIVRSLSTMRHYER